MDAFSFSRPDVAARLAAFVRAAPAGGEDLKQAAVAIVLVENAGALAFVLTRRVAKLRAHGGQWALPGGRCDASESAVEAALRETREEIGLALGAGDVLGVLDDYPTRSGYLISPVVLWAGGEATLTANPDEVQALYRIAVSEIMAEDAVDFLDIPESDRKVIRMRIMAHQIHAPTAAVLYQFREALAGRVTRVAELEQPVFAWR